MIEQQAVYICRTLDAAISEKQFSQQVVDFARLTGWRCYRTWNSVHSPAGFPDLVLVRPPEVLFIELKRERGRTRSEQYDWLIDLQHCRTVRAYVWRPSHWPSVLQTLNDGRIVI